MSLSPRDALTALLEAAVSGEVGDAGQILTEDVVGWSPNLAVTSLAELKEEFAERDDALSNIEIEIHAVDVIGAKAVAEWRLTADHTGPLVLEEVVLEPSGRHVVLAGATFAEFRDDKIAAFRNYFDDAALLEQLLL